MGVIIGIISAAIIVGAILAGAVWYMKYKRIFGPKFTTGGIAFENPSFLKDVKKYYYYF